MLPTCTILLDDSYDTLLIIASYVAKSKSLKNFWNLLKNFWNLLY